MFVKRIFKYVLVSLNLLLAYTSQAQQSSNPFEIIRTDKNSTDTVVAKTPKSDQKIVKIALKFTEMMIRMHLYPQLILSKAL